MVLLIRVSPRERAKPDGSSASPLAHGGWQVG